MNPSTNLRVPGWLIFSIAALLLIFSGYLIYSSIQVQQNTGVLSVSSKDSGAVLTISGSNLGAANIGNSKAKVRLEPGSYVVMANHNGRQATQTVQIKLKQTTNITLDFNHPALPSVLNITFDGTNALLDNGLSNSDVAQFKHKIFNFKPSANKVVIQSGSLHPAPRNPDTAGPNFSLDCIMSIDSQTYRATLTYGLSPLQISLRDGTGKIVFSQ